MAFDIQREPDCFFNNQHQDYRPITQTELFPHFYTKQEISYQRSSKNDNLFDTPRFSCTWPSCEKKFYQKIHLDTHLLAGHTGQVAYSRKRNRKFTKKIYFEKHERAHIREKNIYRCQICGQIFKANGNLKRHMIIHTQEKIYKCQICDYKSEQKSNAFRHAKTHHKNIQVQSAIRIISSFENVISAELTASQLENQSIDHQQQDHSEFQQILPADEIGKHKLQDLDHWWPKDLIELGFLA